LLAHCLFGCSAVRAHKLRALRLPASEAAIVVCWLAAPDPLLRRRPTENSRGALKRLGFGFRQARKGFALAGILPA
jgi:hypothetical protein